jgi:hypothetical protein
LRLDIDTGGSALVEHNTFYNNEAANSPATGQIRVTGSGADTVRYSIVSHSDTTYAFSTTGDTDVVAYVNTFATGNDAVQATAASDTLHTDPHYNSTAAYEAGYFVARAAELMPGAYYVGWEEWLGPLIGRSSDANTSTRRRTPSGRRN